MTIAGPNRSTAQYPLILDKDSYSARGRRAHGRRPRECRKRAVTSPPVAGFSGAHGRAERQRMQVFEQRADRAGVPVAFE
jgi:hypothetical protein